MRDLRQDMTGLWHLARNLPAASGGRVILFIGAHSGAGTSSMAVSFAQLAASHSARMTWLVDLDIRHNPLYTAFSKGLIREAGRPLHALDASLGTEQIYSVPGRENDRAFARLLNAHQIEGQRLIVTRFRSDRLEAGQRLQLHTASGWWTALRQAAEWIVVDAPPASRSRAGLTFVSQADAVVLAVKADETPAAAVAELRRDVELHGGKVLGVVLNGVKNDAWICSRLFGPQKSG